MSSRAARAKRQRAIRIARALADSAPASARGGMSPEVLAEVIMHEARPPIPAAHKRLLGDVREQLEDIAALTGARFSDDPTNPVLDYANDVVAEWVKNGMQHCPHLSSDSPMAVLAAWNPVAKCLTCSSTNNVAGDVEDQTCDRCRSVCLDGLFPQIVQSGFVLVQAGLCDACCDELSISVPT